MGGLRARPPSGEGRTSLVLTATDCADHDVRWVSNSVDHFLCTPDTSLHTDPVHGALSAWNQNRTAAS